jgi:hypothetical protein
VSERTTDPITISIHIRHIMNNGNTEASHADQPSRLGRSARTPANPDELTRLKRELLQAEVRLARARATVVGAEIDIKVLNTRLKEFLR